MKTAGSFKPGQTGNPGGRTKAHRELARYIREKTKDGRELADICLKIARNAKAQDRVRLLALEWLGDRGIGKPVIAVELNEAIGETLDLSDVSGLSDEKLLEIVNGGTDHA